ncbi:hypothetical protein GPECTOR_79g103 [Gonium pectorale]|uniref:Uncharacterized protein n=1 Tax=Gonium pectorale TaxID=33097 RepID=A0A150G1X8_GONPE|nr:hypothetical protein GPECTOR_79g103 [Gonium pectorale]|eukprot:KXZ43824.1 hypothetical protein GPECTOR_79g103 [Gonium pectorale]
MGSGHAAGGEGGGCDSACSCGDQYDAPPPADAYAGTGVDPFPVVDLNSLSGVFVVPTNGSVALRGLELWGVALPTSPTPLTPAAFLALSAFKLPPPPPVSSSAGNRTEAMGAASSGRLPLQLSNLFISTPSCAALSLHQDFACRFSPSPNFTITPTSLTVHRLTTPTADIANVKLVCAGKPAPVSCLAASAATGPQLLASLRTFQAQARTAAAAAAPYSGTTASMPIYLHVCRNLTFTGNGSVPTVSDVDYGSSANSTAGNTTEGVDSGAAATAVSRIELVGVQVVIAGPPAAATLSSASSGWTEGTLRDGLGLTAVPANGSTASADATLTSAAPSTVLDLAGTGGLFYIGLFSGGASVELRDLTIRNPPLGPQGQNPWSLLRAFLWTFDFRRRLLGASKTRLKGLRLTIELQPDELAFWLAEGKGGVATVPRELWPNFCAEQGGSFFGKTDMQEVAAPPGWRSLRVGSLRTWSDTSLFTDLVLTGPLAAGCCCPEGGSGGGGEGGDCIGEASHGGSSDGGGGAAPAECACPLCAVLPEGAAWSDYSPQPPPPISDDTNRNHHHPPCPGNTSQPPVKPPTRFYLSDIAIIGDFLYPSLLSTPTNRTDMAVAWLLDGTVTQLRPPWMNDTSTTTRLPASITGLTAINGAGAGAAAATAAAAAFDVSYVAGALALRGANASLTLRALTLANLPAAGLYALPLPPSGR